MSLTTAPARTVGRAAGAVTTARLLIAGIVSGPLFLTVGLTQAFTREGFDLDRHALSMLALGPLGFVQIANFLITGCLLAAAGWGMRRTIGTRIGAWGPGLIAAFGLGMIIAGVFVADPAFGFPVGTPDGPGTFSWHGVLHSVGFLVAMLSWAAACVVLARRFAVRGDRVLATCIGAALPAAIAVGATPQLGSFGVRIVLTSVIQFAVVAAVAATLLRETRDAR